MLSVSVVYASHLPILVRDGVEGSDVGVLVNQHGIWLHSRKLHMVLRVLQDGDVLSLNFGAGGLMSCYSRSGHGGSYTAVV